MLATALLALDSSTETLCVCAGLGERMALRVGEGGAQASASLLPQVQSVLHELEIGLHAVAAVAFGRGPGAFTGLRTACSVAQGLAYGCGCPVLPIDSLQVVAEAARDAHAPACRDWAVVMDARMGEVYAARWAWDGREWQVTAPAALWHPADLDRAWSRVPIDAWVGTGVALLPAQDDRPAWIITEDQRARALLRLARIAWARGEAVPAHEALPTYVRDKVAQTTAERQTLAARAAAPSA